MLERQLTVRVAEGVHARPAAQVVRLASGLTSAVTIEKVGGGTANAKSIVSLLRLNIVQGDRIILRGGSDTESGVVDEMVRILSVT